MYNTWKREVEKKNIKDEPKMCGLLGFDFYDYNI